MTTLLIILLAVALAIAIYFIVYLRRALIDSEDLGAALIADNERLRQKNSELAVVSTVVYAAAPGCPGSAGPRESPRLLRQERSSSPSAR